MNPALQDTLLQLFEHVQHDPDLLPVVPIDEWQEGSTERQLLESFRAMAEQVQQRIHQLRLAEQRVREQEEQYRSIFEATSDGLIIVDLNGFFVEVNPAFCSMFGHTREELIGLHASVLTAPEALPILDDALKTLKKGRGFQTLGQSQRKDGTTFYSEGSGTTFTYRGHPMFLEFPVMSPSRCRHNNCWNSAWTDVLANLLRCSRSPTRWLLPFI